MHFQLLKALYHANYMYIDSPTLYLTPKNLNMLFLHVPKIKALSGHLNCVTATQRLPDVSTLRSFQPTFSQTFQPTFAGQFDPICKLYQSITQSLNQLSTCLISVSTDSKAHRPIHKA